MPNLKDKVAIITGSSAGIGACTAVHFASLGCNLTLTARSQAKLEQVAKDCIEAGLKPNQVLVIAGDVNDEAHSINVVRKTVEHFGKLDILINNAGIMRQVNIDGGSMEEFDLVMNTNLRSPFRMMQLAVPHLKKTKGNIINVSSVASFRVYPGGAAYSASKLAIDNITQTAALELGPFGVRVNTVNPGAIATEFLVNSYDSEDIAREALLKLGSSHALKRVGQAEEVAKPIAFLASDDASFITGSNYLVDGGYNLIGGNFG